VKLKRRVTMEKSKFIYRDKSGRLVEADGWVDYYQIGDMIIEIGYDKRGSKWYATELTTGLSLGVVRSSRRAAVAQVTDPAMMTRICQILKKPGAQRAVEEFHDMITRGVILR
jgi:hypothetical protein